MKASTESFNIPRAGKMHTHVHHRLISMADTFLFSRAVRVNPSVFEPRSLYHIDRVTLRHASSCTLESL